MAILDWMNEKLPSIADQLEESLIKGFHVETEHSLGLAGCVEVVEVLDDILSLIFPGCYAKERIAKEDLKYYLNDTLRHVSRRLLKYLKNVFEHFCKDRKEDCDCADRAVAVLTEFVSSLPSVRKALLDDIEVAFQGDPAAYSRDEIILSYPFIDAVATYRVAHRLYELGVPIIPRVMSERAHSRTGIDIHPGADIQPGFFIDHGTGVVIGETCRIGTNVKLYQGVTLGAKSPFDKEGNPRTGEKRHPDIEDDVIIYANATILGGRTVIGKGSVIGGNTWITSSVPPGSVVIHSGYPAEAATSRI